MKAPALLTLLVVLLTSSDAFRPSFPHTHTHRAGSAYTHAYTRDRGMLNMAMDNFIRDKLESVKSTFDALTERLSDPDLANDRKAMLTVSRDRKAMEGTHHYKIYHSPLSHVTRHMPHVICHMSYTNPTVMEGRHTHYRTPIIPIYKIYH
jgi:hypothetical protein